MASNQSEADKLDGFRESLKDVVAVAQKLNSHVSSVGQLIEVCDLATQHDGQLALLYSLLIEKKK